MTVEEATCVRVAALSAVTALVGSRVYLDKAPQGTAYPVVVVQLVDDPDDYQLRGTSGARRARIQVDAYAQEGSGIDAYDHAATLADAIDGDGRGSEASGLSGWHGTVGGSPALRVTGCFRIDRTRRYDGDELRVIGIRQDYYVHYRPMN